MAGTVDLKPDFKGWVPARVLWDAAEPMVDWCWLNGRRFTAPFFEQTLQDAMSHPANLLLRRQTPISQLEKLFGLHPGLPPRGFVFHMSRCGSTLIAQTLAALSRNVVLSEPRPIDSILRAQFRVPRLSEETQVRWLRAMVSALSRPNDPAQRHLFIKFDCWHTRFLPLIRRAFPEVPWIFVYRRPLEVLVSQNRQRGAQMLPGVLEPALFDWNLEELAGLSLEDYGGAVLAKICAAALEHGEGGKLVNYHQLPALIPSLMRFWGVNCTPDELDQLGTVARLNAKNPLWQFEADTEAKTRAATKELRSVSRRWLDPLYEQLETRRLKVGFA